MKLEIDSVLRVQKFIQVTCINIDTHIVVLIPIDEYKEWLKINDYKSNDKEFEDTRFRDFVDDYLSGIINHDSTANLLLSRLEKYIGTGIFPLRYNNGEIKFYNLSCSTKYNTYSIVDNDTGRPLTHYEIVEVYDILMKSLSLLFERFYDN